MKKEIEVKKESAAPTEGSRLAAAVLGVMESLSGVMEKELVMLKTQDLSGIQTLREQKARLVREYQTTLMTLKQTPDLLKETPVELRGRLRVVGASLKETTGRNETALKIAIAATKSIIQTVVNAARNENKKTECYGDPRQSPLMLGSYSPVCTPVAVDRTA